MTILGIETSTSVCSAALCRDGELVRQCISLEGGNHARLLPRYIEELLSFVRKEQWRIDAVALSEGPGSYTGLRIGTSTAKGLCYGMDVPLLPVPTLCVLREGAMQYMEKAQIPHVGTVLCPMIDARRMEVYTDVQGIEAPAITENKARAVVVTGESSLYDGTEEVYYFGDGAGKCQTVLQGSKWHYLPGIVPEARYLGTLASGSPRRIEGAGLAYYEPFYLKEFVAAQSHVKGLKS